MSEETKILKPQAPLMRGSDYVMPITTADQVVLADGTRLEKNGKIYAYYADSAAYTPYTNIADNSDFTKWVAQAGIGGLHDSVVYGGDRWILTEGTITGETNDDGDGYHNIVLNGTLVQVVHSYPAVATPFITMVQGEASISYDASVGEIIITSNGGTIKNVLLLEGEWQDKPGYVAKGYAAELMNAYRYSWINTGRLQWLCAAMSTDTLNGPIWMPINMYDTLHKYPSITTSCIVAVRGNGANAYPTSYTVEFKNGASTQLTLSVTMNDATVVANHVYLVYFDHFSAFADLPRR